MKPRRSYGSKPMTRPKAERALLSLLTNCRVEMLAGFTAEGLAASYAVSVATAARMLDGAIKARLA